MQTTTENKFWQLNTNHWFQQLNSSKQGLTQASVNKILIAEGLRPKSNSAFKKDASLFVGQFRSPLMLLLIGAVIISAFLGDHSDVFIILFIVLSTGLLSFFQERNAGKVAEKLQSMISLKATVLRDGFAVEINSNQVVKGDVIILHAGDMLPADCLIIESDELYANEASLTGETYPTRKEAGILDEQTELNKRTNCLWEGTNIVSGNAKALVIQTGDETVFGKIATSAVGTIETPFEKGIKDFGFFLMKITLSLAVFILAVNLISHKGIIESALFALALAVGMAPELLPAITTIAMSAGAKRLLAKKVIVKKLNSIQNLGEVNLLCTDKTGTITDGSIKIAGLIDGIGQESEFVKKLAFWNASLEAGYSNPIDEALKQLKLNTTILVAKIGEVPYDFIRKRLSIAVRMEKETMLICKGAFPQILGICSKIKIGNNDIEDISSYKEQLELKFTQYGTDGLRAIAICYKNIHSTTDISKDIETEMVFAGFLLMNDPVKAGISETINKLQKLNIGLKIITGDNMNVAKSIAMNIGIKNPVVMSGKELFSTSPEALG